MGFQRVGGQKKFGIWTTLGVNGELVGQKVKTPIRGSASMLAREVYKYIKRSAQLNSIPTNDTTLNKIILNKVKRGCSFYYKCLTLKQRQSFNWNK